MNRLEAKIGRECTDWDFDVQQELLERAQKEVRQLKAMLWAIAWSAPEHRVRYSMIDADPYDTTHELEFAQCDSDMTMMMLAKVRRPSNPDGERSK